MFGIGFPELIVILVLALVIIGPKKIPEFARSIGKGIAELRRMSENLKGTIEEDLYPKENPSDTTEPDPSNASPSPNHSDKKNTPGSRTNNL